jgi:hypothetical protein
MLQSTSIDIIINRMIDYFVKPSAGDQLEKNKSTEMTRLPKHTVPTLQDPKICLNAV